ncbi:hypothetical protein Pcinc_038007, partial [Petrolisthes cinctipes]
SRGQRIASCDRRALTVITPPSTIPVPHTLKQGRVLLGALQIGPHPHRCGSGLSSSPGPARAHHTPPPPPLRPAPHHHHRSPSTHLKQQDASIVVYGGLRSTRRRIAMNK